MPERVSACRTSSSWSWRACSAVRRAVALGEASSMSSGSGSGSTSSSSSGASLSAGEPGSIAESAIYHRLGLRRGTCVRTALALARRVSFSGAGPGRAATPLARYANPPPWGGLVRADPRCAAALTVSRVVFDDPRADQDALTGGTEFRHSSCTQLRRAAGLPPRQLEGSRGTEPKNSCGRWNAPRAGSSLA